LESLPVADPARLVEDTIEVAVQVNGKVRAIVRVASDADGAAMERAARADPRISADLSDRIVQRVVVVPGRLVGFVLAPDRPA
jgi:leucyl-tRNA synthetase